MELGLPPPRTSTHILIVQTPPNNGGSPKFNLPLRPAPPPAYLLESLSVRAPCALQVPLQARLPSGTKACAELTHERLVTPHSQQQSLASDLGQVRTLALHARAATRAQPSPLQPDLQGPHLTERSLGSHLTAMGHTPDRATQPGRQPVTHQGATPVPPGSHSTVGQTNGQTER